ncbi:ATP-binding protein [Cryptosporangium phraense]|uniref:ATP-binding protein n=1 Tax=Cryptosporangium phraense TaxID=2593070 RepID=UPI0014792609|nr:ATP-binding protein [Cryptosporangium phraense]
MDTQGASNRQPRRHTIPTATARLPRIPGSANTARRFAADFLASSGAAGMVVEDVVLLVSEVVSNAIEHTDGAGAVQLDLRLDGAVLHVAVSDDSVQLPELQNRDGKAHRGRGLQLVEMLADEWGVRVRPDGKTVWFELTVA